MSPTRKRAVPRAAGMWLLASVGGGLFTHGPAKRAWTRIKTRPVGPPLGLKGGAMVAVPEQKKPVLSGGDPLDHKHADTRGLDVAKNRRAALGIARKFEDLGGVGIGLTYAGGSSGR